ncbi:class I SAM-dependent methyltransferase [Caulobacter sp. KR2-114]|uniref:class I SAM-dependent methyltransferase n=1 Tax=Caulobacter sp. KR2-114 TaxID=3400912 RepID=UPI003C08FF0D
MQGWGGGYVTDIEYDDGFYAGQAPLRLSLASAINGVEPPELGGAFAYCELGCGRGSTSLVLAACYPDAEFHAVDFNPAHIASARSRARAAGLRNITFHELSFEDLTGPGAPPLPQFDIVTMHGVWSWVSPQLQSAIVAFLGQRLQPGGLVYVSYNAMPGWSDSAPLQRLVKELAGEVSARSDVAAEQAVRMTLRLAELKGIPERMQESLSRIAGVLKDGHRTYLAHEHLNEHARPLYHLDVARAFDQAKLSYAGSTDIIRNFHNMVVTAEQQNLLASIASPDLRETVKDFCADTRFRTDAYVRGLRRMTAERRQQLLSGLRLTLLRHPPEAFHLNLPDGSAWRPEPAVYLPVLNALKTRPHRIAELLSLPELPAEHAVNATELIGILCGANLAAIYTPPSTAALEASARLNATILAEPTERRAILAVPGLGGALALAPVDLALYGDLQRGVTPDPEDLARRFIALCRQGGGHPVIDGRSIEDEAEAMALVSADYAERIAHVAPIWKMMQMV